MSALTQRGAIACVGLVLGVAACQAQEFHKPTRALDQRDAGAVHVTVLAVAPWSHYIDALQPRFGLTADQALGMVVRDTRQEIQSSTRGVGVSAAVSDKTSVTGPAQTQPGTSFTDVTAVQPQVEGRDAMMEYWTANSLFQEVQLLNRSVRDAAIPKGYVPYLVRLQITLMPRRRHQPYDAYTTLSFFSPDKGWGDSAPSGDKPEVADSGQRTALRDSNAGAEHFGGPIVLPLLVTDNLESSLMHRSQRDVQQLALSLASLPGTWSSKIDANLFANSMQGEVAGRDLNSLLSVARVSENTLRVRIGALAESTADYAMVPRNHNVTLLLMVPETAPGSCDILARTTLVDAETGTELADTTAEQVTKLLTTVGQRYGLQALGTSGLEELFRFAQANDQRGFRAHLLKTLGENNQAYELSESLWIELVGLMAGSQFVSEHFELPSHGEHDGMPPGYRGQTVILIDDAKVQKCEAVLHNAPFKDVDHPTAMLSFEHDGQTIMLPADGTHLDAVEEQAHFFFPSLMTLGILAPEGDPSALKLSVRVGEKSTEFSTLYFRRRDQLATPPPPAGTPAPAPAPVTPPPTPPPAGTPLPK